MGIHMKKTSVGCRGQIIRESCTCCTFSMYSHDNRVSDNINTLINTYVKKKQNKKTQKSSLCLCCSKSLCCTLYGGEGGREGEKENAKENN